MIEKVKFWAGIVLARYLVACRWSPATACFRAGVLLGISGTELYRRKRHLWQRIVAGTFWKVHSLAEDVILSGNGVHVVDARLVIDEEPDESIHA